VTGRGAVPTRSIFAYFGGGESARIAAFVTSRTNSTTPPSCRPSATGGSSVWTFEKSRYGEPVSGVDPGTIRVKAMVVLQSDSHPRHLVYRNPASETGPINFHRLLGGGVEFGELARDAALGEIEEELGVLLPSVEFVRVVENLFELDGTAGHQVVFVYRAVVPDDLVPDCGAWFDDVGVPMRVEWRPLAGLDGIPLYPAGPPDLTAFSA